MTQKSTRHGGRGARALSRRKRVVFTIVALLLPLLLVGLVELGLRVVGGYGGYPATFEVRGRFDNGDALVTTNPESSVAFFPSHPDLKGTMARSAFRDPKPPGTLRVMLVGGSAIKGYPQTPAFDAGAFLAMMLGDAWPDRDVEIVNLGITAVASFPALVTLTQGLAHEPDLVVIYSGHNEYYGAMGVASLRGFARTPAMIRLQFAARRLAIVQAATALLSGGGTPVAGKMLMEVMAARPYIGPDDPMRADAARNLETHVSEMVRRSRDAGASVIVCTLPVNERGLAPLGTARLDDLNPADASFVADAVERADSLVEVDPGAIVDDLRSAVAAAPNHARAWWLLGKALHSQNAFDESRACFSRAVDLDPMAWRATSAQNEAIERAAANTGAALCDVRAAFRNASEGGSVGWELMDDHVHMSIEGQALVARAIVGTLSGFEGALRVDPSFVAAMPAWSEYAARNGDNPFTRFGVAYRMRRLFGVEFFKETNRGALLLMDQRLRDLEGEMSPSEHQVLRVWADPKLNPQFTRPISAIAGDLAMREGRRADAAVLYRAAMASITPYSGQAVEWAYLHCRASQLAQGGELPEADVRLARETLTRCEFMIANSSSPEPVLHRHAAGLLKVLGDHEGAIGHLLSARAGFGGPGLVEVDQMLVHSLVEAGRFAEALEVSNRGIRGAGELAGSYEALRAYVVSKGGAESEGPSLPPGR